MAEWHHCWRCGTRVPLLDDAEWEEIAPLLGNAIQDVKRYREETGVTLSEAIKPGFGQAARTKFFELTGYEETNANAIWHHRRSIFGPPCSSCGQLLRTPQARFCAHCGASA